MHVFIDGVAFSVRGKRPGGVTRCWTNIIHNLLQMDLRITLYGDMEVPFENSAKLYLMKRYNFRGRKRCHIDDFLLELAISKTNCNLFHSTYYSLPLLKRCPCIVTAFDMIHERFPSYFSWDKRFIQLKKRCLLNASHIISISESTKQDILALYDIPSQKVSVVHLGVDEHFRRVEDENTIKAFREKHKLNMPFLLFVGTRGAYKNFAKLMEAFYLSGIYRDFILVAFGGEQGWTDEEQKILREIKIQDRVRLGGYLSEEELVVAYSCASFFVYPSLYEGFGLPVLEAMACGTPVICSDNSSLPEVGGDVALYMKSDNIDSMVATLRSAVSSNHEERIARGIEWAQQFTWQKTALLTKKVYECVVG